MMMTRFPCSWLFLWLVAFSGAIVLWSPAVAAGGVELGQIEQPGAAESELSAWKARIRKAEEDVAKRLKAGPKGISYEALVPDTLDLADRAALAVNCLTGALDPEFGYELYFVARFDVNPAYMYHEASGLPTNNPKFAESLAMMRMMCGSTQNLDIERAMLARTLALVADDGLYYAPVIGRPWHQQWDPANEDFANVYGNGRLLLALLTRYEYDGNPLWKQYAGRIVAGLRKIARFDKDMAYFPDPKVGEPFSFPKSGYPADLPEPTDTAFGTPMYHSGVIRGLAKYAAMEQDKEALEFARKLANFVRQPKMWTPEVQPAGISGPERGHFSGHFHAHTALLRGLLEYAVVANDAELKEFVRNGYEYARSFGISRIGWFPENTGTGQHCEACAIADMVALAVRLSDAGVGDYWEDVDRYVRNQLAEQQLVSKELLQRLADRSPPREISRPTETDDRVIERNLGGFAGHGDVLLLPNTWIMHCCTANATQALYYAWEGTVRDNGKGTAQINLLLNRASPWLDMDSYLPYEGKVVVRNKTAKAVLVRIPVWVPRRDVRCRVGSRQVECEWVNNYLRVEGLKPADTVVIEFPMVESVAQATLEGNLYTLQFRGNTLVRASAKMAKPESAQPDFYPIYRRDQMLAPQAPLIKKTRYVCDRHIHG
jgi:hypothetical protein